MERERLKNNEDNYPYCLADRETPLGRIITLPGGEVMHILNPQKAVQIYSYSGYIPLKEKLSILFFATTRYIRSKLCL